MNDNIGFDEGNESQSEKILKQFPEEQRVQVKSIWDKSPHARPKQENIDSEEVETALLKVRQRLNLKDDIPMPKEADNNGVISMDWKWMMAAASVLIILSAGFLFYPKSVEVPYGETATVELADGSVVELNSGSELQYSRLFSLLNREVELNGEAFFRVQKGPRPFIVQANSSIVEVTGTRFNVRSWQEEPGAETEVTVTEGSVLFYPESMESQLVAIGPGQISRWAESLREPTSPDSVSLDRVLGWRSQSFAFSKKPLEVILREMERRFDITVTLEASEYSRERVTVHYVNPKDAEVILKDICRVKGLRYSASSNGFRVYE